MKFLLQTFCKGLYFIITDKYYRRFLYFCIRYGSLPRYKIKTINIEQNTFKVPDLRSFIWQYYEIFFKRYYNFKCKNNQPTIIDCGSNIGLSALYFKLIYPESNLYCYEADPKIFKLLNYNMRKFDNMNTFLFNQAVWTKNETLNFQSEGADGGKISDEINLNNIMVDAIDFRNVLQNHDHIDFLKIDIEGAEIDLIPHISNQLHKVDHLFLEYHSFSGREQHLEKILAAISGHGFRVFIQNEAFKKEPFIKSIKNSNMDLQLNIFAYKIENSSY